MSGGRAEVSDSFGMHAKIAQADDWHVGNVPTCAPRGRLFPFGQLSIQAPTDGVHQQPAELRLGEIVECQASVFPFESPIKLGSLADADPLNGRAR